MTNEGGRWRGGRQAFGYLGLGGDAHTFRFRFLSPPRQCTEILVVIIFSSQA